MAPPTDEEVVVDFLASWRFCPVSQASAPSRSCLEDAAKQLLDALRGARSAPLRAAVEEWHGYSLVEGAAERAYEEAGDHPRAMAAALKAAIAEGLRQFDEKAGGGSP